MRFSSLKFDSNVSSGKFTTEMTEQRRNTQQAANHGSFGYHCTLCFVKENEWRCCDVSIFLIKCDCKRWVILMSDDRNSKTSKFAPSFLRSFVRSFFEASFEVQKRFLGKTSKLPSKIFIYLEKNWKFYSNYQKNLLFFFQRCEISRIPIHFKFSI
jgi:hypothetical protein